MAKQLFKVSNEEIRYLRLKLVKWGRNNFDNLPWRKSKNLWHCLVVEIMLQRTKAEQVVPVFLEFRNKCRTPASYLRRRKYSVFKSLGLPQREKLLRKLARHLNDQSIPQEKEQLLALPGIGEYIASAYRSLHLMIKDTIIDSNVVRLYGRFFGFATDGETRRKKCFINLANRITPPKAFRDFNYALIDFTRKICRPKPLCNSCPILKDCEYYNHTA